MANDTRREAKELLGQGLLGMVHRSHARTAGFTLLCLAVAYLAAILPSHEGLNDGARWALFILVFCAGMWITEAIPAVSVSLLAIGLEIAILGRPGGVYATDPRDWEAFIAPWGSPLIWLFFGGFCLAAAAQRTGLDRWMASRALGLFGAKPAMVLLGVMATTAVLSMFMSNTATATMMVAVLGPMIAVRSADDGFAKGVLLGIAFAANVGGMGTIIGTPPNAIAAGVLDGAVESGALDARLAVNFAKWMALGAPPAVVLLALAWGYLAVGYLRGGAAAPLEHLVIDASRTPPAPRLQQVFVMVTFAVTAFAWMTTPLHGVPATVVSFIPICVLTSTGVLSAEDLRALPWDILLLIAGGLSLGVAVAETGLAAWLVARMPLEGVSPPLLVIGFCYLTVLLSNLMSNTATANIVLPIALAVTSSSDARLVIPIALCASTAMCLPISTPPNAIAYSAGRLRSGDLLAGGLLMGAIGPLITAGWCFFALGWL